jgi:hypothetical protein
MRKLRVMGRVQLPQLQSSVVRWWGLRARCAAELNPRVTLIANVSGSGEACSRSLQGSVFAQARRVMIWQLWRRRHYHMG